MFYALFRIDERVIAMATYLKDWGAECQVIDPRFGGINRLNVETFELWMKELLNFILKYFRYCENEKAKIFKGLEVRRK